MKTVKSMDLKKSPDLLSDEEVVALLPILDELIAWAKNLQSFALQKMLEGKEYPGFKVVAGRSQRKITKPDELIKALEDEGYDKELFYEKKLIGITSMEAIVGKKKFTELSKGFIEKPEGAPTLVSADDSRQPINKLESAKADFKEE